MIVYRLSSVIATLRSTALADVATLRHFRYILQLVFYNDDVLTVAIASPRFHVNWSSELLANTFSVLHVEKLSLWFYIGAFLSVCRNTSWLFFARFQILICSDMLNGRQPLSFTVQMFTLRK